MIEASFAAKKDTCDACGERVTINFRETVLRTGWGQELIPVWYECRECETRKVLVSAGVPENLMGASLSNWVVQAAEDYDVLRHALEFVERPVGFFIIQSPTFGNGKSHLAAGMLRSIFLTGFAPHNAIRFITNNQVLKGLRRRYDDKRAEDVVTVTGQVRFLVLDELGVSEGGKDEGPALYEILSERYARKRPTVITTNKSPDEIRGIIGERMVSRLRESTYAWVTVAGPGYRAEKRGAYLSGGPGVP